MKTHIKLVIAAAIVVLFGWLWDWWTPVHPKGLTCVPRHTTTSMKTAL